MGRRSGTLEKLSASEAKRLLIALSGMPTPTALHILQDLLQAAPQSLIRHHCFNGLLMLHGCSAKEAEDHVRPLAPHTAGAHLRPAAREIMSAFVLQHPGAAPVDLEFRGPRPSLDLSPLELGRKRRGWDCRVARQVHRPVKRGPATRSPSAQVAGAPMVPQDRCRKQDGKQSNDLKPFGRGVMSAPSQIRPTLPIQN